MRTTKLILCILSMLNVCVAAQQVCFTDARFG